MGKKLLITEKPSVAMEFAKALKINTNRKNGYLESEDWIITWCVGHLVTMSYPEKYDEKLKNDILSAFDNINNEFSKLMTQTQEDIENTEKSNTVQ